MEILFCIMIFIMGTVFGSFFTLAVYRIPLGLDITHERSFCPNCNHKLEFIDLIPIFSYISLKGKCRYCGKPVRMRYLVLEVLSGAVFLFAYLSFNMGFPYFTIDKIITFIAFIAFYITVVLILGIDKENIAVNKKVLLFGILTQFMYMVYLYMSKGFDIHRYVMYLIIMLILFLIDTITLKNKADSFYFVQILLFLEYILMYIQEIKLFGIIVILALMYSFIYGIYKRVKFNLNDKPDIMQEQISTKIPYAFCIGISTIIITIINNFIVNIIT